MWLTRLSLRRPVFMTMVVVMLMVLGAIALRRLPVNQFPEVSLPVVTVVIPYPGATPSQVEEQVVVPVEDAVAGIRGLKELFSDARESVAVVVVVFEMGVPMDEVAADLRDRVQGLGAIFPDGVEEPIFRRIDPSAAPVLTFAVSSALDPLETHRLVERVVKPRLEQIDGVGAVTIHGAEEREVQVQLDMPKLAELRIPLLQVVQLLGYDTLDIPGGALDVGRVRVGLRTTGGVESVEEIESIVVRGYPAPVYLRDVARVVDGRKERTSLARVDGKRALTFDVVKESGANTVAVCDLAREAVAETSLPSGVRIEPVIDTSGMVRDMSREMRRSLVVGAAMAVLVVFLFMVDWRSTVISATALPTSVVTTFFFMWLAGFSLNMMSLIAMALAIGILIDDAVVVREVIYRHLEEGEDPVTASLRGTAEVALAVLATTLSILAVFIPVGFVGGLVGQFFSEFGLTVAIAVSVSLFIAFTVDPMLSARISKVVHPAARGRAARALLQALGWVDERYRALLAWALDHGRAVVALAAAAFLASLGMAAVTGSEFIPPYDRSQFEIKVDLPPSVGLLGAEERAARVEELVFSVPEVRHVYTIVGPDGATDQLVMRALTSPKDDRDRSVYEVQAEVRALLAGVPGITASVGDPPMIEGAHMGRPVEIELRGDDMREIARAADLVRAGLARVEGATDVRSTWRPGRPELRVEVDRDKAAAAGLSVGQAGLALRMAVGGQVVGVMRDGDRTVDIRVRARDEDRNPRRLLSSVLLLSPLPRADDPMGLGRPVALQDVARLLSGDEPGTIRRHDRQRYLMVSASLSGRPLSDVIEEARAMVDSLGLPSSVRAVFLGEAEMASDALDSLLFALGLAIVFVYAVLASQFESFIHPFTIMLSLPLAGVGALASVFLAGWPVGIPTMLGIILLMGLVTKNAILLVDRANQLRAEGQPARDAILAAGHLRLRPILMTSAAMILGMLPPALSSGAGSEVNRPIAVPVIGGLVASTLLTLLVVPVVYLWVERARDRRRARAGSRVAAEPLAPAAEGSP